uniref:LIM zinc-binding domain-containing protein n=1 Tax=Panagrolaimus superbus TaxID=310955 RepID=A0A914Z4C0_9BILA
MNYRKIPPTAAQPTRVQEPPRGFYQPDILSAGPLSPPQPPIRPPLDSYSRTTVYSNQQESNNDDLIIIGKQSTSATLEARQMSRNFAPFMRSRSVRGIQWPPPPEKAQRNADAIRYWKMPAEPADREKKSLQQLISEDTETHKKPTMKKSPSPERVKMHAKRVVSTPHRLLQPMRNPLDAYNEKIRSQHDLSQESSQSKSVTNLLNLGQPPAVNISWTDLVKAQTMTKSPSQKSDGLNHEKSVECLQIPEKFSRNEESSPEPNSESQFNEEDWQAKSEILEEKDILTDASSIRHSDDEDIEDESFNLPRFDERTSQFLSEHQLSVYDDSVSLSPSMEDLERKSVASTIKEGDDEDAVSVAEKEKWMREEVEQARKEEAEKQKRLLNNPQEYSEVSESVEKIILEELAQTPIPTDEQNKTPENNERDLAIDVIKEHQENLQQQQNQLSELLDNALKYLKDTDYQKPLENSEISETNNNKNVSPQPFNYEDNTPAAKIIRSLNAFEEDGQRKSTIYEQQRMPTGKSLSQPPTNDANQVYTDGIRQHGTLVSQTNMIPYCEQCKQQIRGAYVLATGLTWCPEHFTCANPACNRRLLDTGFVEEKGKKYCEKCFETLIAPSCNKCGMPITADCLTALQKQWHPECFVCHHCSQPFGNAAFYLENGRPYCEQDWNTLFTTKCVACKYPIEAGDRWVEAIGSAFHSNCFSCTVCHTNLEGQSFYAKNGLPFCRIHA